MAVVEVKGAARRVGSRERSEGGVDGVDAIEVHAQSAQVLSEEDGGTHDRRESLVHRLAVLEVLAGFVRGRQGFEAPLFLFGHVGVALHAARGCCRLWCGCEDGVRRLLHGGLVVVRINEVMRLTWLEVVCVRGCPIGAC